MNHLKQARENMIEQQVRPWDVLDQRVLDVLAEVPRDQFVAEEHRGLAYSDYQLPIGFGQTLFKPTVDGRLLQTLALKPTIATALKFTLSYTPKPKLILMPWA